MEDFPGGVSGKESTCNAENTETRVRSLGREVGEVLPGVGNGNPSWYSCLEEESGGSQPHGPQRVGQD